MIRRFRRPRISIGTMYLLSCLSCRFLSDTYYTHAFKYCHQFCIPLVFASSQVHWTIGCPAAMSSSSIYSKFPTRQNMGYPKYVSLSLERLLLINFLQVIPSPAMGILFRAGPVNNTSQRMRLPRQPYFQSLLMSIGVASTPGTMIARLVTNSLPEAQYPMKSPRMSGAPAIRYILVQPASPIHPRTCQ